MKQGLSYTSGQKHTIPLNTLPILVMGGIQGQGEDEAVLDSVWKWRPSPLDLNEQEEDGRGKGEGEGIGEGPGSSSWGGGVIGGSCTPSAQGCKERVPWTLMRSLRVPLHSLSVALSGG